MSRDEFFKLLESFLESEEPLQSNIKTITIVIDYPVRAQFTVNDTFPSFEYGCEERKKALKRYLEATQLESHHQHAIDDYIVEYIETDASGEYWAIGS